MRVVLALVLLSGCLFEKGDVEIDPRMGIEIAQGPNPFRVAAVYQEEGLLLLYEEDGIAWHAVRVAPGGQVTQLPAPPLELGATFTLGRAFAPAEAVLVGAGDIDVRTLVLQANTWTELGATGLLASPAREVVAWGNRVYLVLGDEVWVAFNGGVWSQVLASGFFETLTFGGFGDQTQWVVHTGGVIEILPDGTGGVARDFPLGGVTSPALNGDEDRFQVVADGSLWLYDDGTFTEGDAAPGRPFPAPRSSRILMAFDDTPDETWTYAEDARVGAVALAPFTPALDGDALDVIAMRPSPDTDVMALVLGDTVDGVEVLTVKFLPLPFDGDPFAP